MTEYNNEEENHIPYGGEWDEQDRAKFAVLAQRCPMCDYKFRYADIQKHLQIMEAMEQQGVADNDPRYKAMAEMLARMTSEALDLGLMIAGQQCASNALTVRALIN
jgi:hypothetical protein